LVVTTEWKSRIEMASFTTPSPKRMADSFGYSVLLMRDSAETSSAAVKQALMIMASCGGGGGG
jgi:hypothetical protein